MSSAARWRRVLGELAEGDPSGPTEEGMALVKWIESTERNIVTIDLIRRFEEGWQWPIKRGAKEKGYPANNRRFYATAAVVLALPVLIWGGRSLIFPQGESFTWGTAAWLAYFGLVSWWGVYAAFTTWHWFMDNSRGSPRPSTTQRIC